MAGIRCAAGYHAALLIRSNLRIRITGTIARVTGLMTMSVAPVTPVWVDVAAAPTIMEPAVHMTMAAQHVMPHARILQHSLRLTCERAERHPAGDRAAMARLASDAVDRAAGNARHGANECASAGLSIQRACNLADAARQLRRDARNGPDHARQRLARHWGERSGGHG